MEIISIYLIFVIIAIFLIRVPIIIANNRGISGTELSTISVLSWVGIFFGITWIIALILAIVWQPKNWIEKDDDTLEVSLSMNNLEMLEKLAKLKESGIITQDEYETQKQILLK